MNLDLSNLSNFHLVGVRFSRLSVDERAMSLVGETELEIQIANYEPELSKHVYAKRQVIELRVAAVAIRKGAEKDAALSEVFNLECTAGFIGATDPFDGDLAGFQAVKEFFARSIYWILRERIDSIFAVTVLKGSSRLPWDLAAAVEPQEVNVSRPALKRTATKKMKRKASAK